MSAPTTTGERAIRALDIVERAKRWGRVLGSPLGSVLFAFIIGALMVVLTGGDAIHAYQALLCGGLGLFCGENAYPAKQISDTIVFTTPLILAGIAVAIPFRAGLFNIGAEGQLVLGAIVSTVVGLRFASAPGWILVPLVLVAGALAGAAWGGIAGVLKATTGAHEVVTTIMLNYIALNLDLYLIDNGPMQLPGHSSTSATIGHNAWLPTFIPQNVSFLGLPGGVYQAHAGIFVALAMAVVFWFLLRRTTLGYELRAVGQSQRAARYAGISVRRTIIISMLLGGAFAGLAGAVQLAGVRHNLSDVYLSDTTGFDGIAVALLGQNTAIGAVLSAILFGALHVGGQFMQSEAGVSNNLVDVLQALILFSIAANLLRTLNLRLPAFARRLVSPAESPAAGPAPGELEPRLPVGPPEGGGKA